MIISCTACQTQFRVDEERLVPDGKSVRCSKCGHVWRALPGGSAGAEAAPPPARNQTEASPAAGTLPQESPAPEPAGEKDAPVLSARDRIDEDAGGSEGQVAGKSEPVAAETADADGLTVAQPARLTAAREKKPRSRFWIKVLVVFVLVAGLLLLAQRVMLVPGVSGEGPSTEQPAADVGEVEAKPVPADPAAQ